MDEGVLIQNIVLIGFMGTGKTAVGTKLAQQLDGWSFHDLDHEIEAAERRTIPEIFASDGEKYFRQAESRELRNLLRGSKCVISSGGGAVLAEENRKLMQGHSRVVNLLAQPETIIERVKEDENRPLLQGDLEQKVRDLMKQRAGLYDFADIQVRTDGKTIENVANEVLEALKR